MLIDALKFLATVSIYGIAFVVLMIIFIIGFSVYQAISKQKRGNTDDKLRRK